jgi:hypothetical protein
LLLLFPAPSQATNVMDIPVELRQFEQAINLQIQQAVAAALQSVPSPSVNVAPVFRRRQR